jgi:hypothetical protein
MNTALPSTNTKGTLIFDQQISGAFSHPLLRVGKPYIERGNGAFGGIYTAKIAPCGCNSYLLLRVSVVNRILVGVRAYWDKEGRAISDPARLLMQLIWP